MTRFMEGGRSLYRSRSGLILGVCKGVAEHLDVSVFWTRAIVAVGTILTGLWPIPVLYVAAAFLMKPEPILPFETESDREFYNSYTSSRTMALHRLKRTFDSLDRRLGRMESIVTAREYDWERRLNE